MKKTPCFRGKGFLFPPFLYFSLDNDNKEHYIKYRKEKNTMEKLFDCEGNEVISFDGAYTHFNDKDSGCLTYEIAKVRNPKTKGCYYCLYGYHGLTFDCALKGFLVAKIPSKDILSFDAGLVLRLVAIKNTFFEPWEREKIKKDYDLLNF